MNTPTDNTTTSNTPNVPTNNTPDASTQKDSDVLGDFLAFERFATPVLIQLVFWIGAVISVVWGGMIIAEATNSWRTDEAMVWTGIAVIIIGPTVLRIVGELIIVFFRIHDRLAESTRRD